jgi:hypothetical protein
LEIKPCKQGIKPITLATRKPIMKGYIHFVLTKKLPCKDYIKEICKANHLYL